MKSIIKQHPFKFSLLLYTLLFTVAYLLYAGSSPYMYDDVSDVVYQFIPAIKELKRFYSDLLGGSFQSINYKLLFGTEILFSGGMPFNPFNLILIFMNNENIVFYFKIYYTLSMYLAGIAFMFMCRVFKMKPFASVGAAVLYVFAPYTIAWDILYASPFTIVTAPLMIAGMELIFQKKSGKFLLAASAICVLSGGFYMFFYQLIVTVIFAFVKVIFIKEDGFFKRLWYYGSRGALAALGGLALTAGAALPQLIAILSSGRVGAANDNVFKQAVTLDMEMLRYAYTQNTVEFSLGVVIAPLVVFFLAMKKAPAVNKILLGLCSLCIAFPLFSAVLCAFTYIEHRWVFAFSLAGAYAAAYVAENIRNAELSDRIWAGGALIIYMLNMDYMLGRGALPVLIVYIILINIPPLRKLLDRFLDVINEKQRYILEVIVYLLLIVFTFVMAVIYLAPDSIIVLVEVYTLITISCIEREGCKVKYILVPWSVTAVCIAEVLVYPKVQTLDEIFESYEQMNNLNELQKSDLAGGDNIVRFENIDNYVLHNVASSHDVAFPNIFTNLIPSGYTDMMSEAEFDFYTFGSVNVVSGFEHRLPFMSVWGIDYIHSEPKKMEQRNNVRRLPYTFDFFSEYTVNDDENILYRNNYTLPFGFTYENVISNEERRLKNGADYGINMMYGAAVNEEDMQGDRIIPPVSCEVPCDIASELYKYDEYGDITYTKYTITPRETVTDSEIYITINNIDPYSNRYGTFTMMLNGDESVKIPGEFGGGIVAQTYHWYAARNNYTVCLSTVEELEKLEIIASCDFDDMRLTAYPVSDYIEQYEKLSEYTMENVVLGDDEITGNITLPDDRMLCLQLMYSKGWQAYDNGKKVDTVCVNESMTGIRLPAGEHNIRLVYHVPGLREGMAVSCVTVVILIGAAVIYRKKAGKKSAD
ncbi:MAG: YfhO family protein [Oscillospiraceae bacterium]|nr:YfhO family protein [Oscillospiraceae bacterium]